MPLHLVCRLLLVKKKPSAKPCTSVYHAPPPRTSAPSTTSAHSCIKEFLRGFSGGFDGRYSKPRRSAGPTRPGANSNYHRKNRLDRQRRAVALEARLRSLVH